MNRRLLVIAILLASFFTFATLPMPTNAQAATCPAFTTSGPSSVTITASNTVNIFLSARLGISWSLTGSHGPQSGGSPSSLAVNMNPGDVDTYTFTGSGRATVSDAFGHLPCLPGAGSSGGLSIASIPLITWAHFDDGRLNDGDAFETSAIYCEGDGSVRVYVIGDPKWTIAFTASPAEIAKVPKYPAHNTLIKSANGAALYRLTSGLLQVNSAGLNPIDGVYHFAFEDCPLPK